MNIGQAFLHDSKNSCLHFPWQPSNVPVALEFYFNLASFRETFDKPPQSGRKSHFIQQWRMQQVGHRSDVIAHVPDHARAIRHGFRRFNQAAEIFGYRAEVHGQRRQCLPSVIMQLSSDASPFLVL